MCHGLARPSVAAYWHIGETTTRFESVMPRNGNGEKRALIAPLT
jgi:hypothetical protein